MRPSGAIVFWIAAVGVLLFVEVAELTHLFTLPIESVIGNLISFIFALVFTTILALVGAIFIGIYISQRLQGPGGFTVFEEEMLKMRADLSRLTEEMAALRQKLGGGDPAPTLREAHGAADPPPRDRSDREGPR